MTANDLQIGDWVCAAGPIINGEKRVTPPMRVVAIGDTWVHLLIDPESGDPDEVNIEDIRPISLTTYILLANGWNIFKEDRFRLEMRDEDGWLVASVDAEFWKNGVVFIGIWAYRVNMRLPVFYVHELQHAMRLAGIEKEIEL